MLYLNRKVQDLKEAVVPALPGCVVVAVCWYLALTGEDSRTPFPGLFMQLLSAFSPQS